MSFGQAFGQAIEDVVSWASSFVLHTDAASYCQLETAVPFAGRADMDPGVLINRGGSLMTVLRVDGSLGPVANDKIPDVVEGLSRTLIPSLQTGRHTMDWVFERNDPATDRYMERCYAPIISQSRRLGMDSAMERILRDEMASIRKHVSAEESYLIVYTHLVGITKSEIKTEQGRRKELFKENPIGRLDQAQSPRLTMQSALRNHMSLVGTLQKELRQWFSVALLSRHDVTSLVRTAYHEESASPKWRAVLPGDPVPVKASYIAGDNSGYVWPKVSQQICGSGRNVEHVRGTPHVKIGSTYYGTVLVTQGPQDDNQLFSHIFGSIRRTMPWRVVFRITPKVLDSLKFREVLLNVCAWIGDNASIKRSFDWLKEYDKSGCAVGIQMAFQTWAPSLDLLEQQFADLNKCVTDWGICTTSQDCGDPFGQWASGVSGFSAQHRGALMPAPIEEAIALMPLQRPAAPWQSGPLFASTDGRPYPFNPRSGIMTFLLALYVAPPGSGKSVTMGRNFWTTALAPTGLNELSPVGSIDIGPTQVRQALLLQQLLPERLKKQVMAARMRNSIDMRINPCDTLPGCRKPTALQNQFLLYLLTLLCTPLGKGKSPYPNMDNLAQLCIEVAFRRAASPEKAKRFEDSEPLVNETLKEIDYKVDRYSTWWEVTDALWAKGKLQASSIAQRHAVPTLHDIIEAANSDDVRAVYAKEGFEAVVKETGMTLISQFIECLRSGLRLFPVLDGTTTFDLGDARVIALDLDDVARGSGEQGDRCVAIWMMLCRNLFAMRWYRKERDGALKEVLEMCPESYHAWHFDYAVTMQGLRKTLFCDELHRAGGATAFLDCLDLDGREGRKWGIDFHFASQFHTDFRPSMRSLSTAIYILDGRDEQVVRAVKQDFGFDDECIRLLRTYGTGASSRGGPFLVRYSTSKGVVTQMLYNVMGTQLLWSTNTTPEDMALRDRIEAKLGRVEALEALSEVVGTSAKDQVLNRRNSIGESETVDVYAEIAAEVIGKWEQVKADRRLEMVRELDGTHTRKAA